MLGKRLDHLGRNESILFSVYIKLRSSTRLELQ
jgi:hypothetical protein